MSFRVRTSTFHRRTLEIDVDDELIEVEIQHEPLPYSEPLVKLQGRQLVVAYLTQDDTGCESPLEGGTCNGQIYTKGSLYSYRDRLVTDNREEVVSALGLCYDGSPDIDRGFYIGVDRVTLMGLAIDRYAQGNPDLDLDDDDVFSEHEEEIQKLAFSLYPGYWRKLAGPMVVPIAVSGSRYWTTTWDGDVDELPDGLWIACDGAEENIKTSAYSNKAEVAWRGAVGSTTDPCHAVVLVNGQEVFDAGPESGSWGRALAKVERLFGRATEADLIAQAVVYADAVLKEYTHWAEGEVYGCCVSIFIQQDDGKWVEERDESCWRFIGEECAQQALKEEFFDPYVAALQPNLLTELED